MYIYLLLFFLLGVLCSFFIEILGYRLPIGEYIFKKSTCDKCNHELKLYEKIPIISFIIQRGRCNYCHQRISKLYLFIEILSGILFALTYLSFQESGILKLVFGLLFITSLIIICFSDTKYMIISDEVLIVFSSIILLLKLFIGFYNEEILNLMDLGYALIDIVIDVVIVYLIMFAIKKIGDLVFKKESLGKGDLKMMAYIAIVMNFKLCIVIIFLASFIALPFAIISNLKKDKPMLPFGPCLAIATMILFLLQVDFNSLLELIH
jgi:leader peptidase (prepilin peptidase)/N-methyltransferase